VSTRPVLLSQVRPEVSTTVGCVAGGPWMVETFFRCIEGGGGALHQVVGLAVLAVDLQGDVAEIGAGIVFHLLKALGVDIRFDATGFQVRVAIVPVFGGGFQVRRKRRGRNWRVACQDSFLCPILVDYAAEDRGYCHQQEPAHTSHGDDSNIAR
jgi:hypothetical protein